MKSVYFLDFLQGAQQLLLLEDGFFQGRDLALRLFKLSFEAFFRLFVVFHAGSLPPMGDLFPTRPCANSLI